MSSFLKNFGWTHFLPLFLSDGFTMTSSNNSAGDLRLDCSSAAGAPTLTTPTLTPTTLRNIEQMFLEASDGNSLEQPIVHENAAHFVPPPIVMELPSSQQALLPPTTTQHNPVKVPPPLPGKLHNINQLLRCLEMALSGPPHQGLSQQVLLEEPPLPGPPAPEVPLIVKSEPEFLQMQEDASTTPRSESTTSKRNRNNNNVISSTDHSSGNCLTDEERRKQLRRLRNKEAAARCRKRRLDQTMSLQTEVDKLENVKRELRAELEVLQKERDKLSGILELHQCALENKKKSS